MRPSSTEPFMRWRYHTRMIIVQGRLRLIEGNVSGALAAAEQALTLAHSTKARKNVVRSCRLRGHALVAAGQIDSARNALHNALSIGQELKSPALIWPCHLTLAELEESESQLDVANEHYADASEILEKIIGKLTTPDLSGHFLAAAPVHLVLTKTASMSG